VAEAEAEEGDFAAALERLVAARLVAVTGDRVRLVAAGEGALLARFLQPLLLAYGSVLVLALEEKGFACELQLVFKAQARLAEMLSSDALPDWLHCLSADSLKAAVATFAQLGALKVSCKCCASLAQIPCSHSQGSSPFF
jgi:hypothetical protein